MLYLRLMTRSVDVDEVVMVVVVEKEEESSVRPDASDASKI